MNKPIPLHDPCQLRSLPDFEAPEDLWPGIKSRLDNQPGKHSSRPVWLALAASVLFAVLLVNQFYFQDSAGDYGQTGTNKLATNDTLPDASANTGTPEYSPADSILAENQTERLLAMSQKLENRIDNSKYQGGPVSAREAIIVAELEDLIAVIDEQLGAQNADPELWYRRVTLLADLAAVYDQRLSRNYTQYVAL